MNSEPAKTYQSNIDVYTEKAEKLSKITRRISVLRLFIFITSVMLVYLFAVQDNAVGIVGSLVIGIALFVYLIKRHSAVIHEKKLAAALLKINEQENNALKHEFQQFDSGVSFIDHSHRYASDLDLFGEGSLFQYLNRASTVSGSKTLAQLLCNPLLNKDEIKRNQRSVTELKDKLSFRQKLGSIGLVYTEEETDDKKIREWAVLPPEFGSIIYKILAVAIPLLTFGMIALLSLSLITIQLFFLWLVVPWGIAGFSTTKTNRRHEMVSNTTELLNKYAWLLQVIESQTFETEKLKDLSKRLYIKNTSAGQSIHKLKSILTALDNRLNFVSWGVLNGLFLWDILQMIRLESWQKIHREKISDWFDVISEMDVLCSFANFAYNNPEAVIPEIDDEVDHIDAVELGHPLIPGNVRVNNDFRIAPGEFMIITGANMAGKSTYLRTIGASLILAMCGAPVIAGQFSFKPIDLHTSIRTTDSLFKNESYFYAELKRLGKIIGELRSGKKMFIILDEILKGTNSKDKHKGSEALLKQFISLNTSGIVATHDVSLGVLESQFPKHIRNRCFEVDIDGNELSFDYKIRDGVSQNMNATLLMKKMGITI
ncbi:MAG: hypothetical protein KDC05_03250 [Bacteroidales bacterium]|nr:hypothetical protein [Bacteroidales bacterium]